MNVPQSSCRQCLIRDLERSEIGLLKTFLYEAIFVPEGMEPPDPSIVEREELQIYIRDFGNVKGDVCLAAEREGAVIGAAWARIMPDYGHIDDSTPSLAIALKKPYRGQGIGTRLLEELLQRIESDGYDQVSLSVQKENRAHHLYRRLGFTTIRETDEEYIMVKRFKEEMNRPVTTLFMLASLDGKISTGATDDFDVDRDFPLIEGVKEGLGQYYEIEQTTDLWSFNTGRVMAKLGVNAKEMPNTCPVSFVVSDNHHLTEHGVRWLCAKAKALVIITQNAKHPSRHMKEPNLHVIYQETTDFAKAFEQLKRDFGGERLTLQSGGTVNRILLEEELIDYADIVIAPVLVGGRDTPSLIDGKPRTDRLELWQLGVLRLISMQQLEHSWVRLRYKVIHKGDHTL